MADTNFDEELSGVAVPSQHVIFTDLDGSEGVLVDLNTRKYYQLNETAALIWRGFERRVAIAEIAKEMTDVYDVSDEQAVASVSRLLRELSARKFVRLETPGLP